MAGTSPQRPKPAPQPPTHDVAETDGEEAEPTATEPVVAERGATGKGQLPPDRPDLTVRH